MVNRKIKIGLGAAAVAAVLVAAFFWAPGVRQPAAVMPVTETMATEITTQTQDELATQLETQAAQNTQAEIIVTTAQLVQATTLAAPPAAQPQTAQQTTPPATQAATQQPTQTTTITTRPTKTTVTLSIRCDAVLNNMHLLRSGRNPPIPPDGIILAPTAVAFTEGETVFDLLRRETRARSIHMEFVQNPMFNSAYIRAINNLYEFDFGELSGWMFRVNGQFMGTGASQQQLSPGDVVEWVYVLDFMG